MADDSPRRRMPGRPAAGLVAPGRRTGSALVRIRQAGGRVSTLARRDRATGPSTGGVPGPSAASVGALVRQRVGWDVDAAEPEVAESPTAREDTSGAPLTARVLALLSDPRVGSVSAAGAARSLGVPQPDVQAALDALVQAGELVSAGGPSARYGAPVERKEALEQMFREAAEDLGESTALATIAGTDPRAALATIEDDEPRLPVTAGLLSLFLPGTGQLLNGDVARASLVFAVWSLALLTHLSPIWTFVALYAGAEAFFSAKIRGLERRLAVENPATPRGRLPKAQTT